MDLNYSRHYIPGEKSQTRISEHNVCPQSTTFVPDLSKPRLQVKELLLVLTKGRDDFTVIDLMRGLLRDAEK